MFTDIVEYLKPGDCLVRNNTKVIPARLIGEREETGGKVEVLLLKRKENNIWETLVKPGKKARPGVRLSFGNGLLKAQVLEVVEEGNRLIQFEYDGIFEEILDQLLFLLLLCFVSLSGRAGQLVSAGCGLEAAVNAFAFLLDLLHGHAVHQAGDGFQVAVAAAGVDHIGDYAVIDVQADLGRTGAFCFIDVFHFS